MQQKYLQCIFQWLEYSILLFVEIVNLTSKMTYLAFKCDLTEFTDRFRCLFITKIAYCCQFINKNNVNFHNDGCTENNKYLIWQT